uniref:Uncharacterized protein n=1 Tax=Mus spicilegus TaxID=10103 RepID=A0A8C6I3S8_MUSSI
MYPSNKKKKVWREENERLLKMTLEERRKEYIRDYVSLSTILSWKEEMKSKGQNDGTFLFFKNYSAADLKRKCYRHLLNGGAAF